MSTEQRLAAALRASDGYEASSDLWTRVVHSIEEDRRHRRLVRVIAVAVALVVLALGLLTVLNVESVRLDIGLRYRVRWQVLELAELLALATLVAALGPAIRRFGRGYVEDIFGTSRRTGSLLLSLLDVAYYLVFTGYVLVTARFSAPLDYVLYAVGDQIEEAMARIGGLLLIMGLLHAATLMAMPMIGLVFNSTRTGRKLPRWVTVLLVLAGIAVAWQGFGVVLAIGAGLSE